MAQTETQTAAAIAQMGEPAMRAEMLRIAAAARRELAARPGRSRSKPAQRSQQWQARHVLALARALAAPRLP